MSLEPGAHLGPYEIVSAIGAGGMGEVYRARDTRLQRDVAIKVLPDMFAADPERLARFQREAQVLAALNHPHIAAIYGLEESGNVRALVLELVEGETLADRIARGPVPLDEAWPMARQVAEALEAAHGQGIIHRDLKPSNIAVTPNGIVKVLDFGLAKLAERGTLSGTHVDGTMSPTTTSPAMMTGIGTLLGTAAYMAPEQARGRPADKRSDIWAFGCVLYEMLTGRRPFEGEDVTDTVANALKVDPDWSAFPNDVPPSVRTLLKDCLQKDPRKRVGDVAAVIFVVDHARDLFAPLGAEPGTGSSVVRGTSRWRLIAAGIALAVAAVAATLGVQTFLRTPAAPSVTRFELTAPPKLGFPGAGGVPRFAVSPDGRSIVFAAGTPNTGPFQLWVRRFDRTEPQPLRATAGSNSNSVQGMFWFPDGNTIGFFDEVAHKLKTVDLAGDAVRTLVDVPSNQYSGTANAAGTILYSSLATGGIMRVAASGGLPQKVTTMREGEIAQLWPSFLPDGRHFLYLAETPAREKWALYAGSLDSSDQTLLVRTGAMGQFSPPDQLLYVRGDGLYAQRIDLEKLVLLDEPVLVMQPVFVTAAGRAGFSVSDTGVLVHTADIGPALTTPRVATWIDRSGHQEPLGIPVHAYTQVRMSPDATRVALSASDQDLDLWIWTFARRTLTRLTFGMGRNTNPVWTPDSKRIIFQSDPAGNLNLYAVAADGTGMRERLYESRTISAPSSVSPDGRELIFDEDTLNNQTDLFALTLDQAHHTRSIVGDPSSNQRNGAISPDGRWIAYQSNESGSYEVYVRPYPAVNSGRWQVSTNGGTQPLWARDGKELFYVSSDNTLMTTRVEAAATWTAAAPARLFADPDLRLGALNPGTYSSTYDISADGRRFLVLRASAVEQQEDSVRLVVVLNWPQDLKRFAPKN